MTNINRSAPAPRSRINGNIASLFMTATVILSGFLSLALVAG